MPHPPRGKWLRSRFARASVLTCLVLLGGCQTAADDRLPIERLRLPPGFSASVWAIVPGAHSMRVAEGGGKVYVGTRDQNVFAVIDAERDGVADAVEVAAAGLDAPNGLAVTGNGALIVAERHRVLRLSDRGPDVIVPPGVLPDGEHHGTRYAGLGPDGRVYVAVGAPCDLCEPRGLESTILRMRPDGHELEIFARGVRGPVGFDWHPRSRELFFTDAGATLADGRGAPGELNHAPEPGLHFGFPYRYGPGKAYPGFAGRVPPAPVVHPVLQLGPQAAPQGIQFYRGAMFPASYRHDAFLVEHGAGDSVGHRITRVRFDAGRPVRQEVFMEGWDGPDGTAWGRPAGLEELPDGSLLVSDELAGAIYRVTYGWRR